MIIWRKYAGIGIWTCVVVGNYWIQCSNSWSCDSNKGEVIPKITNPGQGRHEIKETQHIWGQPIINLKFQMFLVLFSNVSKNVFNNKKINASIIV